MNNESTKESHIPEVSHWENAHSKGILLGKTLFTVSRKLYIEVSNINKGIKKCQLCLNFLV